MSESQFFMEVDDEVRTHRLRQWWRRTRWWILGTGTLVLAGVSAFEIWHTWQEREARRAGAELYGLAGASGEDANRESRLLALTEGNSPAGIEAVARIEAARLAATRGDTGQALALLARVTGDHPDAPLGHMTRLLGLLLEVGQSPVEQMEQVLEPLTADDQPGFRLAREIRALAWLHAGRTREAVEAYRALADDAGAPPGTRARAGRLARTLSVRGDTP